MPTGFAGRATAGRSSGGGTSLLGRVRVGLGEGVALLDGVGAAEAVGAGTAEGDAEGDADGDGTPDATGEAGEVDDGASAEERELAAVPDVAGAVFDDGALDGTVVQPATMPAHTSAPRAMNVRLTSSG
jgi:hypothetical protein